MLETEERDAKEKAAFAWATLVNPVTVAPMPAVVAIDMVQDATGDRDDAIYTLISAAADWLTEKMPPELDEPMSEAFRIEAVGAAGFIRCEQFAMAEQCRQTLRQQTLDYRLTCILRARRAKPALLANAYAWGEWCVKARFVIVICCGLCDVAIPPLPANSMEIQ